MTERDNGELTERLRDAALVLRHTDPPSDTWREQLLSAVSAAPIQQARRWSLRPWVAIAAGVMCMVVGGLAAKALGDDSAASQVSTSLRERSQVVRFQVAAPAASRVSIVGDFNQWTPSSLRPGQNGTWEIELTLVPGRYAYSYLVDGRLVRDPSAPRDTGEDFGSPNSIRYVSGT